ncbi:5-oxoprolinase subunit PxpB [Sporomusa acidovorans]|uniref:5-oxoprolinase subunit B n=1 Tax=Sporomusa acidovorans (strain ATCC 49682 / DSM 3132 / Mol) TaxID=1123286 RepID=A0ABZ3IYM7_SPOA4|nr:5-oxoprolinase subunit PxpB [Sporomusa acidovorans]OZC17261.1 kinase A inhibitor [Sporomusa acidovorans DSM 3132]SDF16001.1 inhibitor of KinA [Sporomusa acidovorans]
MNGVELFYAGEQGLVVEFGKGIDKTVNRKVHNLTKKLSNRANKAILEIVPTYRSLLVYFDPIIMKRKDLIAQVETLLMSENCELPSAEKAEKAKIVHIPVCYQEKFAPDLEFVAEYNGISAEEVVRIHTSTPYLVYMLGFTPGFPYLGGMSPQIATPRLEKPRVKIPAGSVGIAGSQTGFYPIESPGGWRLIGRTPVKAFDPAAANPFLFAAGDYLQFEPISLKEYTDIRQQVDAGQYLPEISEL